MKFLLSALLSVIYCMVFTEAKHDKSSHGRTVRMIGGTNTRIEDHPHQVAMIWTFNGTRLFCGGSIVSDRHIVTAAHCIDDKLQFPEYIKVVSGTSRSDAVGGNAHSVESMIMHPGYNNYSLANDIAIVTLKEPINFSSTEQPIKLPRQNIAHGTQATITGWGYTSRSNRTPINLQEVPVGLARGEQCQLVANTQICGYVNFGTGVCVGDSGGPLVANRQLVGVASYTTGKMCDGTRRFDVYTNVYPYVGFIKSIIKSRT